MGGGGGGGLMGGGGLGGDLGGGLGGDMDLDATPDAMEGGGSTGSTSMASAPDASAGKPLQEYKSVIDQYLDMLTEKQNEKDGYDAKEAYGIIEETENEGNSLNFLLEKVENLIGDKDEAISALDEEIGEPLSAETISDEDLLDDEE